MAISKEAVELIHWMARDLMQCKYAYRDILEGCYENAVRGRFEEPVEGMNFVIDKVIEVLDYKGEYHE